MCHIHAYTCYIRHKHSHMFTLLHEYRYTPNLQTDSHKSLNKSIFSSDQFSVVDWMEHPNMSDWVSEPNTGNKADVSQDRQCQICHRNHIAKRRGELTHEIVHNASIIAICHSIDCDNVAVIYKACTLYWSAVLKRWAMLYSGEMMWFLLNIVQEWHMWAWYYSMYLITEVHYDRRYCTEQ